MSRSLLILDLVLLLAAGALWWMDQAWKSRQDEARVAESAFRAIGGDATPSVASIARIDLTLPGSDTHWVAERRKDGWRLPTYRNAFAMPDAIEGLLKALLESRGTAVGHRSTEAERFGLTPKNTLEARLYNAPGALVLHVIAGDVAPGQRQDECFAAAVGDDTVLQMYANPWAMAKLDPASRFPPFTDTRVIPAALGRSVPAKISFSGSAAPAMTIVRRNLPMEELMRNQGKGPQFQWIGMMPDGEKRLNDAAAGAYLTGFATLAFDDIAGSMKGRESLFAEPTLAITIEYDGGASDTLTLGTHTPQGRVHLSNSGTNQVYLVSPARAAALAPDLKALLEPMPASAPTSR
jgi:hypothetical protein